MGGVVAGGSGGMGGWGKAQCSGKAWARHARGNGGRRAKSHKAKPIPATFSLIPWH